MTVFDMEQALADIRALAAEQSRVVTLGAAVKLFAADMRSRNLAVKTRERYLYELGRFERRLGTARPIGAVSVIDCRRYLDSFRTQKPATVKLVHGVLKVFFDALVFDEVVDVSPMSKVKPPKVPALRDRKRKRITTAECLSMLREASTWSERMALNTLAYTGSRRNAVAILRWRDVDFERGWISFFEKGSKAIRKPIADELRELYIEYRAAHPERVSPDDFVVPSKRYTARATRSNRIVWTLVKDVAGRLGIDCHAHSLRAAFAVFLLENGFTMEQVQQLLGHASLATTQVYVEMYNAEQQMLEVVPLSYGCGRVDDRELAVSA